MQTRIVVVDRLVPSVVVFVLLVTLATSPAAAQPGPWSQYSACSVSCGDMGGTQVRNRTCLNPGLTNGCMGAQLSEEVSCNVGVPCFTLTEWSGFAPCSVSCGQGMQTRMRMCLDSTSNCNGAALSQTQTCSRGSCPVNGNWSPWSPWSCSTTCGGGVRSRTRTCDNPPASAGGVNCSGNAMQANLTLCNVAPCPIDGGWSSWTPWACNASCGGNLGVQVRTRLCNAPAPQFGGRNCSRLDAALETNGSSCISATCPAIIVPTVVRASLTTAPTGLESDSQAVVSQAVDITVGSALISACPAPVQQNSGNGAQQVNWYGPNTQSQLVSAGNILLLDSVEMKDGGRYWCRRDGAAGTATYTASVDVRVSSASEDSLTWGQLACILLAIPVVVLLGLVIVQVCLYSSKKKELKAQMFIIQQRSYAQQTGQLLEPKPFRAVSSCSAGSAFDSGDTPASGDCMANKSAAQHDQPAYLEVH
ncbi:hemicentin-1-like [Sycon ciliatum]|uniref:hemicentin-1-like n=1 Tax=Sycon ciliatum TaxID=27933 RepID=UPI0031F6739B